jgi:hypothetical protein
LCERCSTSHRLEPNVLAFDLFVKASSVCFMSYY